MQETGQVGWDPISVNHQLPLAAKLLILYLLVVGAISIVKSAAVLRLLWSLSRDPLGAPKTGRNLPYTAEVCSNKIQSMRRLVFITLFLTVLVTAMLLRASLMQIAVQASIGIAALSGGVVEALTVFALGIFVCTVLYAACALYEGVLSRRKTLWNQPAVNATDQPPKEGESGRLA